MLLLCRHMDTRYKMLIFIVMLLAGCKVVTASMDAVVGDKKSFVFVSGWPQSGTSLLQQIFAVSPNISTMVDYCYKYHAKKCINFNHEGQWMLGSNKSVSDYMRPGKMCAIQGMEDQIPDVMRKAILSQWVKYWKSGAEYWVEKSPASMMKMFPLQQLVAPVARRTKFIVILKHPVSLNVATMKYYEWLFHFNNVAKMREPEHVPIRNTLEENRRNLRTFLELMLGPERDGKAHTTASPATVTCKRGAGWLDGFDYVHRQLLTGGLDARVLRYEDFRAPLPVCERIFRFLHEGDPYNLQKALKQVCQAHFGVGSPLMRGSSSRPSGWLGGGPRRLGARESLSAANATSDLSSGDHRQLRLSHQDYKELRFDPGRLYDSVADRLADFQTLLQDGETCSPGDMSLLAAVNERLLRFGYSLRVTSRGAGRRVKASVAMSGSKPVRSVAMHPDAAAVLEAMVGTQHRLGRVAESVLDPWDLMKP